MTSPASLRVTMLLHKSVLHDSRVRREAKALTQDGHVVTVLELAQVGSPALDGFTRRSVLPAGWVRRALPFQMYRLVFAASFAAGIRRTSPDVIHAHDAAMLLPALIGRRLTGARLVYDSHELATGVPYRDARWARFVATIERIALPRVAAVVTVSDGIAERLAAQYDLPARPVVLRNVSDVPADPPPVDGRLRQAIGVEEAPLVLHQGSAAEGRGADTLLRAAASLPSVHLVLLGPAPDEAVALSALARELAVGHRVHVLAAVPVETLSAWASGANVGVSLLKDTCENHRLALPNKVFEYLAAGIPVVTSDLPELRSLVLGHGFGWVSAPGDVEALRGTLETAITHASDHELRARLLAARERLRWTHERDRLTALYRALARAPGERLKTTYAKYGASPRKRRDWSRDAPGSAQTRAELEAALLPVAREGLACDGELLDVGCGTGWLLGSLASAGVDASRLHGLDLLASRTTAASALVPGADIRLGDATELQGEDGSLTVVTLVTVLSSLERPVQRRVLAECARVLRPGGLLVVYDLRVANPANPSVRGVRLGRVPTNGLRRRSTASLTVAPPLLRRLGRWAGPLYPLLRRIRGLRTHRLWVFVRN